MTYYTAVCGGWKDRTGVRLIAESFNRKEIFDMAQNRANQSGKVVTVRADKGTRMVFTEVYPQA